MKQKIIMFCAGLFTGMIIWFMYDRIEAYSFKNELNEYYNQYEKEEFLAEKPKTEFDAQELYNMNLLSEDGKEIRIRNNGNIIFLNFWATWCKPCIEEMPSIQALYNRSHNIDFYLITYEEINKASTFIDGKGFDFPVYSYLDKTNLPKYFQVNGGGIPDTYIIYDDTIEFHHLGSAPWNSAKVDSLFAEILSSK